MSWRPHSLTLAAIAFGVAAVGLGASTAPPRFLLVGVPLADCAFCIPNGLAGAVEVLTQAGVPGTYDPVTLRGRVHVLDTDPNGLLFRLTDAALQ